MLTSFASHLTTATECSFWIKLSWGPWKHSTAKKKKLKKKILRSNLGRGVTVYQTGEQFGNTYKRAATGEIAPNGFRAIGRFPCDKIIYRPHDFPLSSEDKDAAPVNHPALVKTSDQPPFSSVNFSPFTSAEALRASGISPVPSLNIQPNTRGGTANKITSSPYKKFVGATQKKKIKQANKSKTSRLASNALLGLSKRLKRRFCRDPTPSDTPSHSDTDLTAPFADDSTEEEEQNAYCVFCTDRFSEDHNGRQWIRCAKYFRWAHTLCADMEDDFLCEPCQGWTLFCS